MYNVKHEKPGNASDGFLFYNAKPHKFTHTFVYQKKSFHRSVFMSFPTVNIALRLKALQSNELTEKLLRAC